LFYELLTAGRSATGLLAAAATTWMSASLLAALAALTGLGRVRSPAARLAAARLPWPAALASLAGLGFTLLLVLPRLVLVLLLVVAIFAFLRHGNPFEGSKASTGAARAFWN
jgi:hypothetical protein